MELSTFKELFDQYYTPISNFLYYKCGDSALSEDLTQDVFMKLWDKRDQVKEETVKSYLYTIANNMLLNKIRHDKVQMNFVERHKSQQEEQSPQYFLEEKEFKQKLDQAESATKEEFQTYLDRMKAKARKIDDEQKEESCKRQKLNDSPKD